MGRSDLVGVFDGRRRPKDLPLVLLVDVLFREGGEDDPPLIMPVSSTVREEQRRTSISSRRVWVVTVANGDSLSVAFIRMMYLGSIPTTDRMAWL
jgi:hypothetical protein